MDIRALDRIRRFQGNLIDAPGYVVLVSHTGEGLAFSGFDHIGVHDDARSVVHHDFESDFGLIHVVISHLCLSFLLAPIIPKLRNCAGEDRN